MRSPSILDASSGRGVDMRTYIRSITTFFRWTHRDSLFLLSEDEVDCLVVEALASKATWS